MIGEYLQDEHNNTRMFDILYDERVGGRLTRECHVDASRLALNLNKASADELQAEYILGNDDDGKAITMKVPYLHATSGKDLISKLIALKEDEEEEEEEPSMDIGIEGEDSEAKEELEKEKEDPGDEIAELDDKKEDEEEELTLNHQQLVQLNEALHVKQIKGLITSAKKTLRFITAQLLAMVTKSDVNASEVSNFESQFVEWSKGKQGYSDPTVWFSPGQEGGLLLAKCRASLSANAALIRIMSCHVPGLDLTAIDEERIERAVRSTSSLLNSICQAPMEDQSLTEDNNNNVLGGSSRLKAKSKGADAERRSVLTIVGPAVLPVVRAVLDALELLLGARRQSDRLCVASYELAYSALRAEAASCPRAAALDHHSAVSAGSSSIQGNVQMSTAGGCASRLASLHFSAISVIQVMASRYPTHRHQMLNEGLTLISHTHTGIKSDKIGQTYPVHFISSSVGSGKVGSGNTSNSATVKGSSKRYISTSFAALLILIQTAASSEDNPLAEANRLCSTVVRDIISRSSDKEMGGNYRQLTVALIGEMETALSSPLLQSCGALLSALIVKVISDLQSAMNRGLESGGGKKGGDKTKPEVVIVNFLLEIIGNAGVVVRSIAMSAPSVTAVVSSNDMDPRVVRALKKELSDDTWLRKFSKPNSEPNGPFNADTTLRILAEVTSKTLDTVQEYTTSVTKDITLSSGGMADTRTDFAMDPLGVLSAVGMCDLTARLSPAVHKIDISKHLVCEYIRSTLLSTGPANGVAGAYAMHLSLWHKDVAEQGREHKDMLALVKAMQADIPSFLAHADRSTGASEEEIADKYDLIGIGGTATKLALAAPMSMSVDANVKADMEVDAGANSQGSSSEGSSPTSSVEEVLAANTVGVKESWEVQLPFEWVKKGHYQLLTKWFCAEKFESVLAILLRLLDEISPHVRSRAIKTVNQLFQVDPSLISRKQIRAEITARLNDSAISVRTEVVNLIGAYVLSGSGSISSGASRHTDASDAESTTTTATTTVSTNQKKDQSTTEEALDDYLTALLYRLGDKGVNVRKAVVRILQELLAKNVAHERYSELCLHLLRILVRPKEEDSIRDAVNHTFQDVWLSPPRNIDGGMQMQLGLEKAQANTNTQSLGSVTLSREQLRLGYFEAIALQIVDVVSAGALSVKSEEGVQECLVALVRETLHGKAEGDEAHTSSVTRRKQALRQCEELCKALVEVLLKVEEEDQALLNCFEHKRTKEEELVSAVQALSIFCTAHPPLLLPHLSSLLPYLKNHPNLSPAQQSEVCLTICKMVTAVASLADAHGSITRAGMSMRELTVDLQNLAKRSGLANTNAAVMCLSTLIGNVTNDAVPYVSLAGSMFKAMVGCAQSVHRAPKEVMAVNTAYAHRALIVLSALCEHSTICVEDLATLVGPLVGVGSHKGTNFSSPTSITAVSDRDDTLMQGGTGLGHLAAMGGSMGGASSTKQFQLDAARRARSALEEEAGRMHLFALANNNTNTNANTEKAQGQGPALGLQPLTINGCTYASARLVLTGWGHLEDEGVEIRAVQALCSTFIGCPKLVMLAREEGLLDRVFGVGKDHFKDHFTPLFHTKLLDGLNCMLKAEERRVEGGAALQAMRESGVAYDMGERLMTNSAQDSDVSVTAYAVMQRISQIKEFLQSTFLPLRSASLGLVDTLLRQGLLCPLDIVANLIAMQGDPDRSLRERSLRLLQSEDEKAPHFLDNRLVEGVEQAFEVQLKVMGHCDPLFYVPADQNRGGGDSSLSQKAVINGNGNSNGNSSPHSHEDVLDGTATPQAGTVGQSGVDGAEDGHSTQNIEIEMVAVSVFAGLYRSIVLASPNRKRKADLLQGLVKRALHVQQQLAEIRPDLAACFVQIATEREIQRKRTLLKEQSLAAQSQQQQLSLSNNNSLILSNNNNKYSNSNSSSKNKNKSKSATKRQNPSGEGADAENVFPGRTSDSPPANLSADLVGATPTPLKDLSAQANRLALETPSGADSSVSISKEGKGEIDMDMDIDSALSGVEKLARGLDTAVSGAVSSNGKKEKKEGKGKGKGKEKKVNIVKDPRGHAQGLLARAARLHDLSSFLSATLAHLPYESVAEPLLLVLAITQRVPVDASAACSLTKKALVDMGGATAEMIAAQMRAPAFGSKASSSLKSTSKSNNNNNNSKANNANNANANTKEKESAMQKEGLAVKMSVKQAQLQNAPSEGSLLMDDDLYADWYSTCPLWTNDTNTNTNTNTNDKNGVSGVDEGTSKDMKDMKYMKDGGAGATAAAVEDAANKLAAVLLGSCTLRCMEGLMRLKTFLKRGYHLSPHLCHEYLRLSASSAANSGKELDSLVKQADEFSNPDRASGNSFSGLVSSLVYATVPPSAGSLPPVPSATLGLPVQVHPTQQELLVQARTLCKDVDRLQAGVEHDTEDLTDTIGALAAQHGRKRKGRNGNATPSDNNGSAGGEDGNSLSSKKARKGSKGKASRKGRSGPDEDEEEYEEPVPKGRNRGRGGVGNRGKKAAPGGSAGRNNAYAYADADRRVSSRRGATAARNYEEADTPPDEEYPNVDVDGVEKEDPDADVVISNGQERGTARTRAKRAKQNAK